MKRREWEVFHDPSYWDMWAVRPVGDRCFNSPQLFHFAKREDAEAFRALAELSISAVKSPSPGAGAVE